MPAAAMRRNQVPEPVKSREGLDRSRRCCVHNRIASITLGLPVGCTHARSCSTGAGRQGALRSLVTEPLAISAAGLRSSASAFWVRAAEVEIRVGPAERGLDGMPRR